MAGQGYRLKSDELSRKNRKGFKRKIVHALHDMHMHVEEGIRALIVRLDSNCSNMLLGESGGGTRAPDTS